MSEPIITIRPDDLLPPAQAMAHVEPGEENDWLPDVADEELRVAMIQSALWYWIRDRVDEMIHDTEAEIENLPAFATAAFERALANAECLGAPLPVPWPAQLVCGPVQIDVWRGPRNQRTVHIRRLALIAPTDDTYEVWAEARNSSELADEALIAFDAWRLANDPDAALIRVACGWCPCPRTVGTGNRLYSALIRVACGWCPCPPELAAKAVW